MAARSTQRKVNYVHKSTSDFAKVVQVWVEPRQLPAALMLLYAHMQDTPHKPPAIPEFTVADDRGGSGHYWIRIDENAMSGAEARQIFGKDFELSLEDA